LNRRRWIPTWLREIYAFNSTARTKWVAKQAANVPANSKVLDVGAGSSPYRAFFDHCEFKTHDFVKLEPEQLWGRQGYSQIDYVSDIKSIPVDDNTFDVVLCTEVLEHVPEPILAVKEISRILKPGGLLLLTAPLGSGLHQEPYHFYGGYTPYWYEKFLPETGFEQIKIVPNGGFFHHYRQESMRFLMLTAPWRGLVQLFWAPFWFLYFAWGLIWIPLWASLLDRHMDKKKGFTVGYHVLAIKNV